MFIREKFDKCCVKLWTTLNCKNGGLSLPGNDAPLYPQDLLPAPTQCIQLVVNSELSSPSLGLTVEPVTLQLLGQMQVNLPVGHRQECWFRFLRRTLHIAVLLCVPLEYNTEFDFCAWEIKTLALQYFIVKVFNVKEVLDLR